MVDMVDGIFGHQFNDAFIYFDEYCLLEAILMSSYDIQLLWYFKVLDNDGDDYLSEFEYDRAEEVFPALTDVTFDDVDTDDDD